ncbi:MAG: glycine--tRNA ligase subunit beta [Acidobacteriia bacterium]|nr:glycine--tRNA ligase subunit beta [Terriglobia bacterium]
MKHSTLPLLVELGCEEIPARFLDDARDDFGRQMLSALGESRLLPASAEPARWYSTPRRLTVWVPAVLAKQPDVVEELIGPPVKVGLDPAGKPTRAAESFAAKNAARVADLVQITTPKGQYLALKKTHSGQAAVDLLPGILPGVVSSLNFPKSMYWVAKSGPRFVRPIRWILALWGEGKQARTIPFEIAGVKAGNVTCGHRILGRGGLRVQGFADYLKKLQQAGVELDPEKRRTRIRAEIKALLEDLRLRPVEDNWLEAWIVNSTEWPTALLGQFDRRYLHLPREILVTVMRDHQKYFAVEDGKGNLQPRFVTVLNLDGDTQGRIREGHQRVLSARFADAEFFWNADQKATLQDRRPLLDRVTYQAELGSYGEKVQRMKAVARELCAVLEGYAGPCIPDDSLLPDNERAPKGAVPRLVRFVPMVRERVLRAVELCKSDLTTQMVQEFPELQGVVGGLYASAQGESSQVSEAIYDHYLPQGAEDRCPRSMVGAIVSLADKIDSVVGGFAVGHEPTGSSDPFALRRQGNGIIKVMVENSLPLPLRLLVERALNILTIEWRKPQLEVFRAVLEFLEDRLRYYLETVRRLRYDSVRAVLAAGWDVPVDALWRAEALERVRGSENFESLSLAAKRIKNILGKSATAEDWRPGEVDAGILEEGPERELYVAYGSAAAEAGQLTASGEYDKALAAIAGLRPAVDRFFDKVLVMTGDRGVRQNRLRLLGKLDQLFSGIARFAEIVGGPGDVDASTLRTVKSDK